MTLDALRSTFKDSTVGKAVMAGALALPLTFGGLAANDARAGEPQAASTDPQAEITHEQAIEMADAMDAYSRDPKTRGIGIFINLQADAAGKGDLLGQKLLEIFGKQTPPVPAQYRVHQSRGTATDITFYVRGIDFTVNMGDLRQELGQVFAHHRGAWLPERVSLNTQPQ